MTAEFLKKAKNFLFNIYKSKKNRKNAIIFAFSLFFASIAMILINGLTLGIDLKGGYILFVPLEKQANAQELMQAIYNELKVDDVKINSTPTSIIIQLSSYKPLENAEKLVSKYRKEKNKSLLLEALQELKKLTKVDENKINSFENEEQLLEYVLEKLAEAENNFAKKIVSIVEKNTGQTITTYNLQRVSPIIGNLFWQNAIFVAILAIVFIAIAIFAFFRNILPLFSIIFASVANATFSLAMMSVFALPLSLSSIVALLMLFGYSVDTNIVLTTKLLKRKDSDLYYQAISAFNTGITMTLTSFASIFVLLLGSYFFNMQEIFSIAFVLVFGLLADVINTWLFNASFLINKLEKK